VAGLYERAGARIYNTAVLIGRDGSLAGRYRKMSLPDEEIEGGITPGSETPVFDTDFGRVGLMICWDSSYPEVARALATRTRLLLLDEVMAGLLPTECDLMVEVFRGLNKSDGLTILLIEHVMRAVMALAQHIGVLHHGEVIARGTPEEIVRDPAVLECYLGEETEV